MTDATIGTSSSFRTKNNFGLTGNPAYTIFLAIQYLGADGGQGHPFFWGCEGPPGSHQGFEFEPSGWLDIAGGHGHDYTTMAKGPWEDFNLISARHTTPGPTHATTMVAVNGKGVDATGASITLNIDDSPAYVGFWPFSGGVRGINGMIAEIIVYNRALTDGEENAIGYYLTRKYGIATAYVASP